jgi:hypothetical protein
MGLEEMDRKGSNARAIYALDRGWTVSRIDDPEGVLDDYRDGTSHVKFSWHGDKPWASYIEGPRGEIEHYRWHATFREALARFDGNGGV